MQKVMMFVRKLPCVCAVLKKEGDLLVTVQADKSIEIINFDQGKVSKDTTHGFSHTKR